jgi:Na+/phosphate symporter
VQAESLAPQVAPSVSATELPARPASPRQKFQPVVPAASAVKPDSSAISQAVNEVTHVVESLKQALNQMEDVLELVELAERQKLGDEREIESLRRALRQLQPPRSGQGARREHDV